MIEIVFWRICADFPGHEATLEPVLQQLLRVLDGKQMRWLEKVCREFFETTGSPWSRYDAWLAAQGQPDLRTPDIEDEEEISAPSYREAGELLAHRLVMACQMSARRQRYFENVRDRPYWALVADGDCPGCKDESTAPLHWNSAYWQKKQLPCEWLGCRSRMRALTESESKEWKR
jgi:hypothetical protein